MKSQVAVGLIIVLASLRAADAQSSFGRTPGNFAVSSIGSAQYSIPIWTPPGPAGIQPNLSLAYDSNSGVGPLGIGWSIAGLAAISRCNKTFAQDEVPSVPGLQLSVALATSDAYCLNGNRLRLTGGTYGTTGSTYQTELADFSNISAHGTTGNGPQYFTVQGRDGRTYYYGFIDTNGNGANSQVTTSGTATTWFLSKIADRSLAGNNLVINYLAPNGTTLAGTVVPDTILWTPVSAGASTYSYSLKFNYTTNVPQSSLAKYLAGSAVINGELLSSIAISYQGTVLKDYFLGYQSSPATGRYELNSIKECADSAESTCLQPTTVGYQGGTGGLSTTAITATTSSTPVGLTARYDLNGDGIPDLIYSNGGATWVAFGSPTGFQTPFSSSIPATTKLLIGNLDGGTEDGALVVVSGTWWYYKWNGSTFTGTSTGLTYDSTQLAYQLADLDGDGKADLVSWSEVLSGSKFNVSVYTRLNTSSGGSISFGALNTGWSRNLTDGAQLQTPDMQFGKIRRFDFDNDGRDDLVFMVITGNSPSFTMTTYALISDGSGGFTASAVTSVSGASYAPLNFISWNDDGCTDFIDGAVLFVAACNGNAAASFVVGAVLAAIDWNGDGRTDLVVANGSTLGVYLSTGQGVSSLISTSIPYTSSCQYVTTDANGDGLDDLACWSQTGSNPITYYLHNGPAPDLATSFTDGYGVTFSPTYVPLPASGGVYAPSSSSARIGPMYLVSSYTSTDGIGGTFPTTYGYSGAVLNLQGRGFQGFTTVSSTDGRTGLRDTRTYSTAFPNAGMLTAETLAQSTGVSVSVGSYVPASLTLDTTANNQRYFPYTATSSVNTYEVQVGGSYNGQLITTTAINYGTPDTYGNFSSVVRTVTDEDSGSPYFGQQWTTTTATTITASPGNWCNSLPTEQDVTNTAPGVPAITRHLSYVLLDYPDCRQTEQVVESGSAYQVDTKYGYDPNFGTLTSEVVTGAGMTARTTSIALGTTGQFPVTVTNALNQTSHTNFDPNTGKMLSFQDPNGITTSWFYDAFERKYQENRPDGTGTFYQYIDCASIGGCFYGAAHSAVLGANIYNKDGSLLGFPGFS